MTSEHNSLASRKDSISVRHRRESWRRGWGMAVVFTVAVLTGCTNSSPWRVVQRASERTSENSQAMLSNLRLLPDGGPSADKANSEFERAMNTYREKNYANAQRQFHRIAYGRRTPLRTAEKALFFEAECLRVRGYYPDAGQTYTKVVKDFPRGAHHYDALQRMFDIASFWLEDTRKEMKARNDPKARKNWLIRPVSFVNFDTRKPMLDMEGHALSLLEHIYLNDIDGPLGEKALFWLGSVHFLRENWVDADHYFNQVVEWHANGKYTPRALELSILCKQLIPGGPEYDGRKVAEARELIHQAKHAYPELRDKHEFLLRQLYTVNHQQASKDFMIARFYERTGHPGSAYFYYGIVRQRYPGTKFAEQATTRMDQLKMRADREKANPSRSLWDLMPFGKGSSSRHMSGGQRAPDEMAPGGQLSPVTPEQRLPQAQPGGPELGPPPRELR